MIKAITDLIPTILIEWLFHLEAATIRFHDFSKHPPVLIYQMGKVGSSTVYHSLQQAHIVNPVYQIHFLNEKNIQKVIASYYQKAGILLPKHFFVSRALIKKIKKMSGGRIKLISLVRDPIARTISDLFENTNLFSNNLPDQNGQDREKALKRYLEDLFAGFEEQKDYASTWFDQEMKPVFKIDVYDHPFDHQSGFQIIRKENIDLLILKMEVLSTTFDPAIRLFLNTSENVRLLNSNVGNLKSYSSQYQQIKNSLVIPEETCRKIYSTKYGRHFFDEPAIHALIEKWSGRRRMKE